jgi:RNA polymerase sigma factor (TIGR02999 family)
LQSRFNTHGRKRFLHRLQESGEDETRPRLSLSVPPMNEVTQILNALSEGDRRAAEQLLPLVYEELRRLASQKMAQEKPGQTIQATGLVHEAYLRLVDVNQAQEWNSRNHFFAAAAEAMRRILVEEARRKRSEKRGGDMVRQNIDALEIALPEIPEDLIALDEALTKLAATDQTAAQVVHLRFFSGLSLPEVARHLGISPRTADRLWAYARAWLHHEIQGDPTQSDIS